MNRLYVGNLSFDTSEEALRDAFSHFGEVGEVRIVMDRDTGRPRGFAFVSMADAEGARRAIAQMDGTTFGGRQLRVNEAEERNGAGRPGGGRMASGGRR
jgi:cold-inducible RNA-binding protein